MTIDFINSEQIKLDGNSMILSRDPKAILNKVEETLKQIGPMKFYSSPDNEIKKIRESFVALFLMYGIQKERPDRFVMLTQPQNDPPDFIVMTIGDKITEITMDAVELVEVPPRVESEDEMLEIIKKKLQKGYSESYHLLVFLNNVKSKQWVMTLDAYIKDYKPFRSIWIVYLLENPEGAWYPVVHTLRPKPLYRFEVQLSEIKFPSKIPECMEEIEKDGHKFLGFKKEARKELAEKIKQQKKLA